MCVAKNTCYLEEYILYYLIISKIINTNSKCFKNKKTWRLKFPNYRHFVSFLVYFSHFEVSDTKFSQPTFYSSHNRKHTCLVIKLWECRWKRYVTNIRIIHRPAGLIVLNIRRLTIESDFFETRLLLRRKRNYSRIVWQMNNACHSA